MRDNNENWYGEQNRANYNEKLRPNNFFQRNKVMIIILSTLVVLVAIFASTTFYLLTKTQSKATTNVVVMATPTAQSAAANATSVVATPTPPATPAPSLGATVTSPAQPSAGSLTTSTKNYQFICITNCDDKFNVVLNDVNLNTTNQTMAWDFTITDNGEICSSMSGQLALESPTGDTIKADGGTFVDSITMNAGQELPRTATFSSIPHQGIRYTTNLQMYCSNPYANATYQAVLFNY